MIPVIISVVGILLTVAVCAMAAMKGDAPERLGATVIFVSWIVTNLVVTDHQDHAINTLLAIDVAVLAAFAWLAWRWRRSWIFIAAVLQAIGILAHVTRDAGVPVNEIAYFAALTTSGYGVLIALGAGAVVAWREREALRPFDPDDQIDGRSPAKARSIRSSVLPTPKIATNDPKRGPWL